jgi:hypothetical protein
MDATLAAPALLGITSAFGLAASAGLNTTLPLLCVGLLAHSGWLSLASPYDTLASPVALVVLAALAVVEFVADKVPAVDTAVHAAQWPLAAAAGAILFASQSGVVTHVAPPVALALGLLTAGGVHGARTAARPVVTGTTLGVGNPLVSFAEDGYALALAGTSALVPAVALLLLALLLMGLAFAVVLAARGGRAVRRWLSQ